AAATRAFTPMSGVGFLVCLCAHPYFANEPAGDQRASRAYGPADQGNACRADGKLKVSAAHSGRRIEPPGKLNGPSSFAGRSNSHSFDQSEPRCLIEIAAPIPVLPRFSSSTQT